MEELGRSGSGIGRTSAEAESSGLTRRRVLGGAAQLGLAASGAYVLAGCGSSSSGGSTAAGNDALAGGTPVRGGTFTVFSHDGNAGASPFTETAWKKNRAHGTDGGSVPA